MSLQTIRRPKNKRTLTCTNPLLIHWPTIAGLLCATAIVNAVVVEGYNNELAHCTELLSTTLSCTTLMQLSDLLCHSHEQQLFLSASCVLVWSRLEHSNETYGWTERTGPRRRGTWRSESTSKWSQMQNNCTTRLELNSTYSVGHGQVFDRWAHFWELFSAPQWRLDEYERSNLLLWAICYMHININNKYCQAGKSAHPFHLLHVLLRYRHILQ